jgi:hypothetical protein
MDRVAGKGSRVTFVVSFLCEQDCEEAYMSVGFGSYVDTGITGSHTPQHVRVALLKIVSEIDHGKDDQTYGIGLLSG